MDRTFPFQDLLLAFTAQEFMKRVINQGAPCLDPRGCLASFDPFVIEHNIRPSPVACLLPHTLHMM